MKNRKILIGAGILTACGSASAEVIIHTNDGTFDWLASSGIFQGNALDITQDANQSGEANMNTFERIHFNPVSSDSMGSESMYASGLADRIVVGAVEPGEMIGDFSTFAASTGLYTYTFANYPLTWLGPSPNIGVKIELDGQDHFGWIRLQWIGNGYDPIAWAYETEPGVPIMATDIPAPASLAPLAAFGALAMRRRR